MYCGNIEEEIIWEIHDKINLYLEGLREEEDEESIVKMISNGMFSLLQCGGMNMVGSCVGDNCTAGFCLFCFVCKWKQSTPPVHKTTHVASTRGKTQKKKRRKILQTRRGSRGNGRKIFGFNFQMGFGSEIVANTI